MTYPISSAHVVELMGSGWTRSLQRVDGLSVVVDVRPTRAHPRSRVAIDGRGLISCHIGTVTREIVIYPATDMGDDVAARIPELMPRLASKTAMLRIDAGYGTIGPHDATDTYARALRAHLAQSRFQASCVVDYLESLPLTNATPVLVKIGRTTFVGATFDQVRYHSPGTRAYADGARKYIHSGIYLLGELPRSHVNGSARAYVDASGDDARWFIGSWWSSDDAHGHESHPLGSMFMLTRDDHGVTLTGVRGQSVKDRTMTMSVETIS